MLRRFAGEHVEILNDTVHPDDSLAGAVAAYREAWTRVDAVVDAASLDEFCREVGDEPPVNLRWVLMHLLEVSDARPGSRAPASPAES